MSPRHSDTGGVAAADVLQEAEEVHAQGFAKCMRSDE